MPAAARVLALEVTTSSNGRSPRANAALEARRGPQLPVRPDDARRAGARSRRAPALTCNVCRSRKLRRLGAFSMPATSTSRDSRRAPRCWPPAPTSRTARSGAHHHRRQHHRHQRAAIAQRVAHLLDEDDPGAFTGRSPRRRRNANATNGLLEIVRGRCGWHSSSTLPQPPRALRHHHDVVAQALHLLHDVGAKTMHLPCSSRSRRSAWRRPRMACTSSPLVGSSRMMFSGS